MYENQTISHWVVPGINRFGSLQTRQSKMTHIFYIVCTYFKVEFSDVLSASRKREIVTPRQMAMYIMWKVGAASLVDIGKFMNRDHSSVVYARQTVEDLMQTDRDYAKTLSDVMTVATI